MPHKEKSIKLNENNDLALIWIEYFKNFDLRIVSLYAPNAILLPTQGKRILVGEKKIEGYFKRVFTHYKKYKIRIILKNRTDQEIKNVIISSYNLLFQMYEATHLKRIILPVRVSMVFQKSRGMIHIVNHHISSVPEGIVK